MSTVIVTTPEELARLVDERMEAALLRVLPEAIRRANEPEHMERADAAEFLGISLRSLDYRLKNRALPHIKRGRRTLIPTTSLREYLEAGKIESTTK